MKNNVAVFDPDTREFYHKGVPNCAISTVTHYYKGIPSDRTLWVDSDILSYILSGYQIDEAIDVLSENFTSALNIFNIASLQQSMIRRDLHTDNYHISLSTGLGCGGALQYEPLMGGVPLTMYKYEYDIHSCMPVMMMYHYYLSDNDDYSNDYISDTYPNPIGNVTKVNIIRNNKKTSIVPWYTDKLETKYLHTDEYPHTKYIESLIKYTEAKIHSIGESTGYDVSKILFGALLGGLLNSMNNKTQEYTWKAARVLMQLSSWVYAKSLSDSGVMVDAVLCNVLQKDWSTSDRSLGLNCIKPYKRLPGKRYVKRVKQPSMSIVSGVDITEASPVVFDYSKEANNVNIGWISFTGGLSGKNILHIDINNAYPSEYSKETSKPSYTRDSFREITKDMFGMVIHKDINLYQKIRINISEYSHKIVSSFDNNLLYWKVDGGIVEVNDRSVINTLEIMFPDVLFEFIEQSDPLILDDCIDMSSIKHKFISREFGRRIYATDSRGRESMRIEYRRSYKDYINTILESNGYSLDGLRENDKVNILTGGLTNG